MPRCAEQWFYWGKELHKVKAAMREKFAYGAGGFSLELITGALSFYLMLYHTNILGISSLSSGTLFLAARAVDAVTDLVMAGIADRTRSRWGTYRPYLLIGAIPIGILFALNFWTPAFVMEAGSVGKLVWAYITYLMVGSIMATFCGVPFGSLNSVMSADREDRSVFGSARSIGANISYFVISLLAMTIILSFGTVNDSRGWNIMGVLFGIMGAAGFLLCFMGTKERIKLPPKEKTPISESLKALRNNKPLYGCIGILLFFILMSTYFNNFTSYFCIYYLEHAEWTAPLTSVRMVVASLMAVIIPVMARRLEKRKMVFMGCLVCIVSFFIMYAVNSFGVLMVAMVTYGIGYGLIMPNVWAMIPEASDFGEWKNKIAAPAFIYAVCMFALKVASGFASYFVGLCLDLVGFDSTLTVQTEAARQGIHLGMSVGALILTVCIIFFTFLLKDLDRKNLKPILDALDAERKNNEEAVYGTAAMCEEDGSQDFGAQGGKPSGGEGVSGD